MRNPFKYGGVVSGEAFCNREKETGDLVRAMENGEKLFVAKESSHFISGTSLIILAVASVRNTIPIYILLIFNDYGLLDGEVSATHPVVQ